MDREVVVKLNNVKKTYKVGVQAIEVLKGISFDIYRGDFLIIFGPSGCGKSTMLHILLGLEPPTEGDVTFLGTDFYTNTDEDFRSQLRKRHIGMVYQQANWVKALNVMENVAFPLMLIGTNKNDAFNKAQKMLKEISMDSWASYIPTELSGGQQQRVALARALINDPEIIVADEPTGSLDFASGQKIMDMLWDMNRRIGKTIIMVTHDLEYLKYCSRVAKIFDGALEGLYEGEALQKLISGVSASAKRGIKNGTSIEESVNAHAGEAQQPEIIGEKGIPSDKS